MFGKLKDRLTGGAKKLSGKTDLLEGICAMCALTASADGDISETEMETALNALTSHAALSAAFTPTQIEQAFDKQLKRATGTMSGKLGLKREIEEAKAKNSSEDLEMALMIAIDVAAGDGQIGAEEKKVLTDLAQRLGFNLASYL